MNEDSIKNCRTHIAKQIRKKKKNIWSEVKLDIFAIFQKKKKNKATIHAHFYAF